MVSVNVKCHEWIDSQLYKRATDEPVAKIDMSGVRQNESRTFAGSEMPAVRLSNRLSRVGRHAATGCRWLQRIAKKSCSDWYSTYYLYTTINWTELMCINNVMYDRTHMSTRLLLYVWLRLTTWNKRIWWRWWWWLRLRHNHPVYEPRIR